MANKDRPPKMQKKPKKGLKLKGVSQEDLSPMTVEVVKRKRKERLPEDDD